MRPAATNEPPDPRTGDWEPEDTTACTCGLRADEERDTLGEHHLRRCPRFAFETAAAAFEPVLRSGLVRFTCLCGHVSEHSVEGPGRLVGVQCGCGREMRRAT